jgi:hypothetical protein
MVCFSEIGRRAHLIPAQLGKEEISMRPTLEPGTIAMMDRDDKRAAKNEIYAVRCGDNECTIKRIHIIKDSVLLLSDNKEFRLYLHPPRTSTASSSAASSGPAKTF